MIKDSGERREFETGAVRDIQEGKGRCDLLPLDAIDWLYNDKVLFNLNCFIESKNIDYIRSALDTIALRCFNKADSYSHQRMANMLLEVAVHYEEGAMKYGEYNWQKGIPTHCYLDSAIRHYLKLLRGDTDERHDRAFVWNLLGLVWTMNHKLDLDDIKGTEGDDNNE